MTPTRQLVKHDPANGQYGDCARACIAALLDLPADQVPNFAENYTNTDMFWRRINEFLAARGLAVFSMAFSHDPAEVLSLMQHHNENLYYMMGIGSPRADHFIVCKGGRVACDPAGYIASEYKRDSTGYTWINLLVPLSQSGAAQ